MENRNNLYKIRSNCERLRRCIYLNKVSLLLHTRFRTTSFQQNNPISKKMPDSKTLCSIYELTLEDSFFPILETLCTLVFSMNVFLLYRTTDASLLSPQTTSIQNPILKIKDRRYVRHEATHRVNAIRCGYFLSPPPTLCIDPIAALPDLCPKEKHAVQWRYKARSRGSQLLLLTADKEMRVVLYSVHTYLGFSLSNTIFVSLRLGEFLVLPREGLTITYLGMYRILSATTNPTLKNRLEAGRKGIHNIARDNTRTSCSLGYKTKTETRIFFCYNLKQNVQMLLFSFAYNRGQCA